MKPEEFEIYIIPPNFMEGGTLFGGLLKTRNTIEAVILGLAFGVPVLRLPFSLTVRVVILCLTALPLVLLALIGVSGMSLSAFIFLRMEAGMRLSLSVTVAIGIHLITNHWMFIRLRKVYEGHV